MEMQIENEKRNRKNKIEKVDLKIENEIYTFEKCKIINPIPETSNPFTEGMVLYEKSEIPNSKRLYLGDKTAQFYVTKMIDRQDFDSLFRLEIYEEGHTLKGNEKTPIIFPMEAVKQIRTYKGFRIHKDSTIEIFLSQGTTPRKMPEGDFYVGYFTDDRQKTDLYLRRGKFSDRLSTWSIKSEALAKAAYQQECEKRPYLDKDGNIILDKWKEFLKTKKQNPF